MSAQTLIQQSLIKRIGDLPPEKMSEVADFVEFLAQRQEQAEDAADVAEVHQRQTEVDPTQRRTLDDLRQAWNK